MDENYFEEKLQKCQDLANDIYWELAYQVEHGVISEVPNINISTSDALHIAEVLAVFYEEIDVNDIPIKTGPILMYGGFAIELGLDLYQGKDFGKSLAKNFTELFVSAVGTKVIASGLTVGASVSGVIGVAIVAEGLSSLVGEAWDYFITSELEWHPDEEGVLVGRASSAGTPRYVFQKHWETLHEGGAWELTLNHPSADCVMGFSANTGLNGLDHYYFSKSEGVLAPETDQPPHFMTEDDFFTTFLRFAPKTFSVAFDATTPDEGDQLLAKNYYQWSESEIVSSASNKDMDTIYAATHFKPFVIEPVYELSAEELDACTEQYLEDRGLYLYNWINRQDEHTAFASGGTTTHFFDADYANEWLKKPGSGIERTFYWGSDDSDDITHVGGSGENHLYGEGGSDSINGSIGKDYIEGGDGDDTIDGKDQDDLIYGGKDLERGTLIR